MPVSHRIYPDLNLLVVTMSGRLTVSEIMADHIAYHAADAYDPRQNALVDASGVTSFRVTFGGLVALSKFLLTPMEAHPHSVLNTLYVPGRRLYRIARLYEQLSSSQSSTCTAAYREIDACWRFLGIARRDLPPELARLGPVPTH
jgi:hypothetical protein